MSIGSVISTGFNVNIDGIDVEIKKIEISQNYNNINNIASNQSIRILGEISNKNYISLDKWFNGIFGNIHGYTNIYKKDIIFNTVKIMGIYPLDYDFNSTGIRVTFSADYISGDLHLFQLQQLRKAKLKRLEKVCQRSS